VRWIGRLEGVSFLLLLGVAMPLKYLADRPEAVRWVGWAHGILFVALGLAVLVAWWRVRLSWRDSVVVMVAALLPFGPFVVDRRLRDREAGG